MLETTHRDGRGRVLAWTPSSGATVATPTLIVPETSMGVPEGTEVVLTSAPTGREGVVELVSAGTWFHPEEVDHPLAVHAPQPGPTGQVQVLLVGEDVAVWHDAGGWANNPRNAVPSLMQARRQAAEGRLLWAPALGTPADYAVWAYLGVDAFDASGLLVAASRGVALSVDGPLSVADAQQIHGDGRAWDVDRLVAFNLQQAHLELARIRHAIANGSLRALAERRAYAHPSSVELLRRFDREHRFLESAAPVHKAVPLPCMTQESLWSPEVERFRRRFRDEYTPPAEADVLVLLPCSATKPYRTSPSHRFFQRALDDSGIRHRVHEVMVTSPLGLVPRELEEVYPADRYDVPVTGHWNRDEEAIIREQLAALLAKQEYAHVVAHVPTSTFTFLRDLLPEDSIHSAHTKRPQSKADCDRLRDTLRDLKARDPKPFPNGAGAARKLADMEGIASVQFGAAAASALVAGARARGRWPYVKLEGPEGQRGMTTEGRGLISLTLEGAAILAAHRTKRVMMQDFQIKKTGSLFAVGVEAADADVRPGDDVVVVRAGTDGDEVRAVGQALMSAEEMTAMKRGVAVQLRHVVKADPVAPIQEVA